jgi:hypothetical protein
MKELLLKVIRNPGVRKAVKTAVIGIVLAVAAALGLGSVPGCASLGTFTPDAQDAIDQARALVACHAEVLKPYVGVQAEALVRSALKGDAIDLPAALDGLDLSVRDVLEIKAGTDACHE